jgi:hypothetical protein
VANFKDLLTADNGRKNIRAGRYPDRLSNGAIPEYKSEALPYEPNLSVEQQPEVLTNQVVSKRSLFLCTELHRFLHVRQRNKNLKYLKAEDQQWNLTLRRNNK